MAHIYTEDQLVEQAASQLFAELGWRTVSAMDEVFGASGTLGRETKAAVVLEEYQIVIPKGKLAKQFSSLFADIIAQQQTLVFQIQNLRRTRDLLLPRLLSGQEPLA